MLETAVQYQGLQCRCIENSLESYRDEWDNFAKASGYKSYASTGTWVSAFVTSFVSDGLDFRCLAAFQDDNLVGVLPLITSRVGIHRDAQIPFNHNSYGVDMVISPGAEEAVSASLLQLAASVNPGISRIVLRRVSKDSPIYGARATGVYYPLVEESEAIGAYVDTSGEHETYLCSLNRNFHRNVERLERKAVQKYGEISHLSFGHDEHHEAFRTFLRLESSGWKGRARTSIGQDERLLKFYSEVVREFSSRGWMDISFLKAGEEIVAGYLGVRFEGRLTLLKIAFDENFSSIGPGTLLIKHTLKRAFEDKSIHEVDCLTYYAWNSNWNMMKRDFYTCKLIPRGLRNLALEYAPAAGRLRLSKVPVLRKIKRLITRIGNRVNLQGQRTEKA